MIVFCIRNIYARLEEMQMELERLEIQQYGMAQTNADAQSPDKLNDVDYVGSLDTWEVGKPTERTETEVLQRLGELGADQLFDRRDLSKSFPVSEGAACSVGK